MEELKLYLNGIVCVTCLSSDRELRLIEDISQIQELLPNIRLNTNEDKMCWECRSILTKFIGFRQKASEAQNVFNSFVEGNLTSIKSFSNLKWELTVDGIKIKMKDQSSRVEIQSEEDEQSVNEEEMEEFVNNSLYEEVKYEGYEDDENCVQEFDRSKENSQAKEDAYESMESISEDVADIDDILMQKLPDNFNIDDDETNKIIHSTLEAFLQELTKQKQSQRHSLSESNDALESDHEVNENEDSYIELQNYMNFDIPKSRALKRYRTISRKKINKEEMDDMLERERENTCYKNAYFKCEKCVYGYNNVNQFTDHLDKHDESKGSEICGICEQRFLTRKLAIDHYLHHFMAFYCTVCGYTSRFLRFLVAHQKKNECRLKKYPIWFYCDQCDEKFALESLLHHHKKTIHKLEHICKYCNKSFAKDYNRRLHEHLSQPQPTCRRARMPQCAFKNCVSNHRNSKVSEEVSFFRIHTGRNSVQCDICNKFFVNKSSFQFHLKSVHHFSPKKSVYCKICNKYYKNKNAYNVHERSHAAAES